MTDTVKVVFFNGGPLSQWKTSKFTDDLGIEFISAEQYMLAKKAIFCQNEAVFDEIMSAKSSKEAKDAAKKHGLYNKKEWLKGIADIVYEGNLYKYDQDDYCFDFLMSYPRDCYFVYCNPYDKVLGNGWKIQYTINF